MTVLFVPEFGGMAQQSVVVQLWLIHRVNKQCADHCCIAVLHLARCRTRSPQSTCLNAFVLMLTVYWRALLGEGDLGWIEGLPVESLPITFWQNMNDHPMKSVLLILTRIRILRLVNEKTKVTCRQCVVGSSVRNTCKIFWEVPSADCCAIPI